MRSTLLLIFVCLVCLACKSEKSIEGKIDVIFNEFKSNISPGVSVAVVKDNKIIYQKGFGLADIEKKIKIEPKTNFRLASITKQFTALSILLLEQQEKLDLDDAITKYIPELPNYADKITIKNILQHTSGLLDYENFIDTNSTIQLKDKDVLDILIKQDSTYFNPGYEHRYSNSGYAVLAILLERLSGRTFPKFLEENIFKQLDMNETIAFVNGVNFVPNRSFGYANTDSGFVFSDQSLSSAVLGDGGIYSSTLDLIKWDKEVNTPTLIMKEKFNMFFEKGKNSRGEEFDYGFGWRLDPYKNYSRKYHTGGTCGFSNIYMTLPDFNLSVIVLINIRDYDAKGYAEKIADLFINQAK